MTRWATWVIGVLACGGSAFGQGVMSGKVLYEAEDGRVTPFSTILTFASLRGGGSEARGFRTWETEPVGWWRISGGAGNYSVLFSSPAHFMRPVVLNNVFLADGEKVDGLNVRPSFDYFRTPEKEWDKAGRAYWQTFVARGTAVTQVGFRLASDGVDGAGPRGQDLEVSVHRKGEGTPETWERVGPAGLVKDVDSGGAKNYLWSAGWNSGEVPLTPGETYAVRIGAKNDGGVFQPFWGAASGKEQCYRVGADGVGVWTGKALWMAVSTDGDGLLVPYNKRVHKQFGPFAGFAKKWSQTYAARGRAMGGVILYAAVGGAQPPLSRQRVVVRVRKGGVDGPVVGAEKIAIGNGNYTGDASWGTFGVAYAPDEVLLEPGQMYAIEWESIETERTVGGWVNIKGQVSDGRAGFNPYRKQVGDEYEAGKAYKNGMEEVAFDLDAQVIEYEVAGKDWAGAVEEKNLLGGEWKEFDVEGMGMRKIADGVMRVEGAGAKAKGKAFDGGFVQRVEGLSRGETYRASARVRATWPVDVEHACMIGVDPTGQVEDARAGTIRWAALPGVHGEWVEWRGEPVRPMGKAVSVWVRGRAMVVGEPAFVGEFGEVALRQVRSRPPRVDAGG